MNVRFLNRENKSKKQNANLLTYSKLEFPDLEVKRNQLLAHGEVPQICYGSAACKAFAVCKTLVTYCRFVYFKPCLGGSSK